MKSILKFMYPLKFLLVIVLFFQIYNQLVQTTGLIYPIDSRDSINYQLEKNLRYLGAPDKKIPEISFAIRAAEATTGIRQELITSLIKTESDFRNNAISKKNYKGYMQTPKASFEYAEVDILYGAKILQHKLKITDGDLLKALTLYKGGNNQLARKYAIETLELYKKLISKNSQRNGE